MRATRLATGGMPVAAGLAAALLVGGIVTVSGATPVPGPPPLPPSPPSLPESLKPAAAGTSVLLPPPPPSNPVRTVPVTRPPVVRPTPNPARGGTVLRPVAPAAPRTLEPFPLRFVSDVNEIEVEAGATNAVFKFRFTNSAPEEVRVDRIHTSCGCTTAKAPDMPWAVAPGAEAEFEVAMDLRGKRGKVSKMVYLYTSKGFKSLTLRAVVPNADSLPSAERLRNIQISAVDRQAVFRADCAQCHADPGVGKTGRALFQAVCAVCHEAEHRAEMVPDLRTLSRAGGEERWRQWVTHGKAGTLMPAFAQSEGGPLDPAQIESLVDYLVTRFPEPGPAAAAAPPPPTP